jgi:hypothetical protein
LSFKKGGKKALTREEFLRLKPVKNPLLEWSRTPEGNVIINVSIKKDRKSRILSKFFPIPEKRRVKLDKIGSFVWDRCDEKHPVEEIIQGICNEFKMKQQDAEASLSAFLQQLFERRLIGITFDQQEG